MTQLGTEAELSEAANALAKRGNKVLACKPRGKIPVTPHGLNDATDDLDIVAGIWRTTPTANIGIACAESGFGVLDNDPRNGGDKSLAELVAEFGPIPKTVTVETGGGGEHYYFRIDPSKRYRGIIRTGIDFKFNGYVIAPPSIHESGNQYRYREGCDPVSVDVAEMPEWLADIAIVKESVLVNLPGPVSTTIPNGQRNATLTSLAGTLRRRGVELSTIRATLHSHNAEKCNPPLPDGEVNQIAESVARYAPSAAEIVSYPLTDLGNGERFVARYGDIVRYVNPWHKFLVWDGTRWRIDTDGEVDRLAKLTAKSIFHEAATASTTEEQDEIARHAKATQSQFRLSSMIELAKSEKPIPVAHEHLDGNAWGLNCPNGTIELKTGELRPHDKSDLHTMTTGVEYHAGTVSELWNGFLVETFGNVSLIGFVQRLFGSALVGEVHEHILPILWGSGANGKSVFAETLQCTFGDYALKAPAGLLMTSRNERHPTELADLYGKRLVVISETGDGQRLDERLVKEVSGGDTVRARRMRENFWSFKPSHMAMLITNHKPVVRGTDNGIWRRIRLVPFTNTVPVDRQDPDLSRKLRNELPAVLAWLVEGCLDWQCVGLKPPQEVLLATDGYRAESDTFAQWFAECVRVEGSSEIKASIALKSYQAWCEERGERPVSGRMFGDRMAERITGKRCSNGTYYQGVAWQGE